MDLVLQTVFVKDDTILSFYEHTDNEDYIVMYNEKTKMYLNIPEWDYSIDRFELEYLQNGYDILYISDRMHGIYWNLIDRDFDEIENREGLSKYIDYCRLHNIYHEYLIETCQCEIPDIFRYYEEPLDYESKAR